MEDLKAQHREYYWKHGVSPFKEDNHHHQNKRRRIDGGEVEGSGDNDNGVKSDPSLTGNCVACGSGSKSKAMPLTNYCQLHILSDKKQKLYTCCTFVNKRFTLSPFVLHRTVSEDIVFVITFDLCSEMQLALF